MSEIQFVEQLFGQDDTCPQSMWSGVYSVFQVIYDDCVVLDLLTSVNYCTIATKLLLCLKQYMPFLSLYAKLV